MQEFKLNINGEEKHVRTAPARRLTDILRNDLQLTGTKVGCDAGDCGACTILLDGKQVCACLVPVAQANGSDILTVEGLDEDGNLNALQASFHRHGAAQCGICTPGMLMAATELLRKSSQPSEQQINDALGGVLCRCTGYRKIIEAILYVGDTHSANTNNPAAGEAVGARVAKLDGKQKVNGSELYGADSAPKDALWLRTIRSPYWSATFSFGDFAPLKDRYTGLVDILTASDVPGLNGFGIYPDVKDQPVFADGVVRYRGDAMLALVGDLETIESIRDDEIPIKWKEENPLQGFTSPLAIDAPQIHRDRPGNILAHGEVIKGSTELGFRESEIICQESFETGFVEHAYIEPEAGWAQRVGDRIEITVSTQSPYMDRDEVALILGIPPEDVRIIPTACGGGFGGKLDQTMQPLVAIAAWKLKQPVRCIFNRPESMAATTKRHPSNITARYGCDKEGKLQAFEFNGDFNTGAYTSWGLTVKDRVPIHASGPYFVPNIEAKSRAFFSNETPAGAFRGFGVPQAAIAHDALMDMMAEKTAIDPLEIRYLNAIRKGQETATGQILESAGLDQCLEALRDDWKSWRTEAENHNTQSPIVRRGVGIGCMWYGCGNTSIPNPSTMHISIKSDGTVTLFSGAQDIGQGTNTTMMQAAADALGIPLNQLNLVAGDTDLTADAGKSSASRQAYVSGNAAKLAGEDLRSQILRMANVGDNATIEFENGKIFVREKGTTHEIDLSSLQLNALGEVFRGEGQFDPPTEPLDQNGQGTPYGTYGFAAQIADVAVDTQLGTVKVLRIAAAHDVGQSLNPQQVEGQIHGGVAQGLGLALMEEFIPGKTENLHDYLIPTFGDIPNIKTFIIEDPEPTGPWGAKGIGEPALCATAPAIFGGIYQATGVRIKKAPCTPDRLLKAIILQEKN
ncbi:MAG: molybdopterin cofactor-binding domain-containing protein [Pseudomonadota bacterium]|nr:molybdopterin cofactor-binding domain-containing protein [Pseudomonadota bacterium]